MLGDFAGGGMLLAWGIACALVEQGALWHSGQRWEWTSPSRAAGGRVGRCDVGQELHAEGDVPLLVLGDAIHSLAEPGEQVSLVQIGGDEVLAGLRQRRLDHDVV